MLLHPPSDPVSSVLQTLVLYSLAEHQNGHAKIISVAAAGHSFSVEDDGRGHAIGRSIEGSPYLNFIYCHLDYPYEDRKPKPIQLQGLGMSLLNRLCTELAVSVCKNNASLSIRFQDGRLVSHELTEAANETTGNKVSGKVNTAVWRQPLDEKAMEQWLLILLEASPSLHLFFNGQQLRQRASGA
jgi:DNA gyrase/topoisomerase IV subunit B